MTAEIYRAIEKRISDKVEEVKQIDWFMDQYAASIEDGMVWITPTVFLEFMPVTWQQIGQNIQSATMQVKVHFLTDNDYEDQKSLMMTNHLQLNKRVHKALQNWGCLLSYVEGYEALQGTGSDMILINNMTRVASESEHQLRQFVVTTQTYEAYVTDLSMDNAADDVVVSPVKLEVEIHKIHHF